MREESVSMPVPVRVRVVLRAGLAEVMSSPVSTEGVEVA